MKAASGAASGGPRPTARVPGTPWARWRQRFNRWWDTRHPRSDRWELTQNNIYIVPTKAGLVFGLTLVVMLLASINYQLNLGYVLTFLLAGSGLSSMHLTHRTLRGLTLQLRTPPPGFAGEAAVVEVVVDSPGAQRHGVGIAFDAPAGQRLPVWVDVPALGQAVARLSFVPATRGMHDVPTLRVETRFPLGLFRAWSICRPLGRVLAWPAPESPAVPLPSLQSTGTDTTQARRSESGEFEGVRAYRRGDGMRQVVWKKAARTGELVSRDHHSQTTRELWLDWQSAQAGATEARLSRLAAWVMAAEQAGIAHGLRLPGVELPPGHGDAHRRRALEALALWA